MFGIGIGFIYLAIGYWFDRCTSGLFYLGPNFWIIISWPIGGIIWILLDFKDWISEYKWRKTRN